VLTNIIHQAVARKLEAERGSYTGQGLLRRRLGRGAYAAGLGGELHRAGGEEVLRLMRKRVQGMAENYGFSGSS